MSQELRDESNLPYQVGCAAIVIVVAAIPAVMIFRWLREPFGPAHVIQSERPLGLEEARELTGLPLPDSAKNIRYAQFSQWVAYEAFLRFEAPEADCVAFAKRVISDRGPPSDKPASAELSSLEAPVPASAASSSELDTRWFDVQAIRHGLEGDQGSSHGPKVWIDTERRVCYYKLTD